MDKDMPIGFFDSGLGGLSVLAEARRIMPGENYIYYGDSANVPYGGRTADEIKGLTLGCVDRLMDMNIKALVIACNTATAVVAGMLRSKLSIPVIGMEPAVKPAMNYTGNGPVLVMATRATLSLPKFGKLIHSLNAQDEIIPLAADNLARLVETGSEQEITQYLKKMLTPYKNKVSTIVLGCTHYVFCKDIISSIMPGLPIIDGNRGTALHLKRVLTEKGLLNNAGGELQILSSLNESIDKYHEFFEIANKIAMSK